VVQWRAAGNEALHPAVPPAHAGARPHLHAPGGAHMLACASPLASLSWHRRARRPPPLPLSCCLPSASCSLAGPAGAGTGIACPVGVEGKIASPAGCVFSIACRRNKALGGGWKSPRRGRTRKHQERVQRGPCRSYMSLCAKGITGCTGHGPILAQAEASDGVIEGETNAQDYCT
jgi:hypothetical protein